MTESAWKCAGCGAEGIRRRCDCATAVLYRKKADGDNEYMRKQETAPAPLPAATRVALPERRPALSEAFGHEAAAGGTMVYEMTIGFYDESLRRPGEIFLTCGKSGTDVETNARDASIAVSIALQYGVPAEVLARAMTRNANGSPSGPIGIALERLITIAKEST